MDSVQPWMRLKVKADTFFLPDENGTVYFRNNLGSFKMEGASVEAWIEKLLPVFNGQHTLSSLTDGLPAPYRNRIYEIADILLKNGYVRDVSMDAAPQLSNEILRYFAPQIEFVDNLVGAGAARFEKYRGANVLAVGFGQMLVSLVSALLESGLETVNLVVTRPKDTNTERFNDSVAMLADAGIEVTVRDVSRQLDPPESWREMVRQVDAVLYVSENGNREQLRQIESSCGDEHRLFFSAICVDGLGIVASAHFDEVWQRIHAPVFRVTDERTFSWTAGAVLTNVLAFQLFKDLTGVDDALTDSQFYTLNLETLEGQWHQFIPRRTHAGSRIRHIGDFKARLTARATEAPTSTVRLGTQFGAVTIDELLTHFASLTDVTAGIFHVWDEGDLPQLPLATCQVQPISPLSPGPAELLPNTVCAALTHEEARREAGLTGIEMYAATLTEGAWEGLSDGTFVGVGAGATDVEAFWRGLHQCLMNELQHVLEQGPAEIQLLALDAVSDEKCQFYLLAASKLGESVLVGRGQDLLGFPVVFVGLNGHFVGAVGLNLTMALQYAFAYTLLSQVWVPSGSAQIDARWTLMSDTCVVLEGTPESVRLKAWNGFAESQVDASGSDASQANSRGQNANGSDSSQADALAKAVVSAFEQVERHGKQITVWDLAIEPFMTEGLAGVFAVSITGGQVQ